MEKKKKKYRIKPTDNQKKAFKTLAEKGGKIGKAMIEAGYSEETSKTPTKMTKTQGWQKLMDKYLPDSLLAEKHNQLLNKEEIRLKNNMKTGKIEKVKTGQIDTQAVSKGLDLAYKLKGRMVSKIEGDINLFKLKIIRDGENNKTS